MLSSDYSTQYTYTFIRRPFPWQLEHSLDDSPDVCCPSLTDDYNSEVARDDRTRIFANTLPTVRRGNFARVTTGFCNASIVFKSALNENKKKRENKVRVFNRSFQ